MAVAVTADRAMAVRAHPSVVVDTPNVDPVIGARRQLDPAVGCARGEPCGERFVHDAVGGQLDLGAVEVSVSGAMTSTNGQRPLIAVRSVMAAARLGIARIHEDPADSDGDLPVPRPGQRCEGLDADVLRSFHHGLGGDAALVVVIPLAGPRDRGQAARRVPYRLLAMEDGFMPKKRNACSGVADTS